MRKPTTLKTQLVETVSDIVPVPAIGDNSGEAIKLPTFEATHDSIEATLVEMASIDTNLEYARQKLAHLLWNRHDVLVATKPATPFAHDMATNNLLFTDYLDALVVEFTSKDSPKIKVMTPEQREKYGKRTRRRLFLALELFCNLAWFKANNPEWVCEWNSDTGRWDVNPNAFVPPNHKPAHDLLLAKDGKTLRHSIAMESEESNEWYVVTKNKGQSTTVNLSLDQFNHAVRETIRVLRNPQQDAGTTEATPSRQRRAARQPNATPTATDAAAAEADVASTDSDTPEADAPGATTDRQWALGQLIKNLIAVDKFLNHDTLANLSWSDLPLDAVNAITSLTMVVDKMNAKPDGKAKSKPAKLAA